MVLRLRLSRPRYADVAATVALALTLGAGTAYAGGLIGTDDLRKGAVTKPKIAASAVDSKRLGDGTVQNRDLRPSIRNDIAAVEDKTAREQTIVVPPAAFRGYHPSTLTQLSPNGVYVDSGEGRVEAPLALPTGSTITEITYYYRDNVDPLGLTIGLGRIALATNSVSLVDGTVVSTQGMDGATRSATLEGLSVPVPFDGGLYVAADSVDWATSSVYVAIKGVRITYVAP